MLGDRDLPLDGATVRFDDAEGTPLGTTDGDGIWLIPESFGPATLAVEHVGFLSRTVELRGEPCPRVVVRLRSEPRILGRVTSLDGLPLPGLLVHARRLGSAKLRESDWLMVLEGESSDPTARTEEGGRFRLTGLVAGEQYELRAGGSGRITLEGATVTCPSNGVQLLAGRVFAAALRLVDESGTPIDVHPDSMGTCYAGCADAGLQAFALDRSSAVLAGLGAGMLSTLPHERLFLFHGESSEATVGPCALRIDLPGYAPLEAQFLARAVDEAALVTDVVLASEVGGRAEIQVIFETAAGVRAASPLAPAGKLLLRRRDGRILTFRVRPEADSGFALVSGVPVGSYEVAFHSRAGTFTHPRYGEPLPVVDVVEGRVPFVVPIHRLGTLRIEIRTAAGEPYRGPAQALCGTGTFETLPDGTRGVDGAWMQRWSGPPYSIPGLLPGEYSLRVLHPRTENRGILVASVLTGRETTSTVRMRR